MIARSTLKLAATMAMAISILSLLAMALQYRLVETRLTEATKAALGADLAGYSALYQQRRIIALRQAHPALRTGGLEIESAGDLVVFRRFERAEGGERLLCVFNLGFTAMDWSPPVGARRIAAVNWTETDGAALRPLAGLIFADAG